MKHGGDNRPHELAEDYILCGANHGMGQVSPTAVRVRATGAVVPFQAIMVVSSLRGV